MSKYREKAGALFSLKISGGRRLAVMMKMKYFIVIILGIALLTGCGSKSGQSVQTALQTETENKSIKEETVMQTNEEETESNETEMIDITESVTETMIEAVVESETTKGETTVKPESSIETESEGVVETGRITSMKVQIEGHTFYAALENNNATAELVQMMKNQPIVISMSDYSGFEKVGSLGTTLSGSNSQMTTQAGDIVLYNNSQIVIFYGSNSWSYTKLGHVDDLTGWEEALGSGDVTVTFSIE